MGLVNKKQPQVANFTGDKEYTIKQKYKLLNYCKGGAFGDVYFAKHVEKGYEVAIKFVSYLDDLNNYHSWIFYFWGRGGIKLIYLIVTRLAIAFKNIFK